LELVASFHQTSTPDKGTKKTGVTMTYQEIKEAGYRGTGGGAMTDMRHPGWQFHLQQMVIANDPIKYLGEHLDD
jgi:hypothetical protein